MFRETTNNYIPIRVDVTSNDDETKLRIVDTLLLDRNVLPLPDASLPENALYIAKSMLADAEVIGMGRTVRHFTGRLDLWSWDMIEQIEKCILEQLVAAFEEDSERPPRKKSKASHVIEQAKETNDDDEKGESKLIPIRIRMEWNGHRIHDDFDWDHSLGTDSLTLAKSIAHDLNLPSEVISELTAHIAEQMLGLVVVEEGGSSPEDAATATPMITTAAWTLEPRVHQSNLAHLAIVNTAKN